MEKQKSNWQLVSFLTPLILAVAVSGCATGSRTSSQTNEGGAVGLVIKEAQEQAQGSSESQTADNGYSPPLEVWGEKLQHNSFDIPVVVNPSVEKWITYFKGKGRKYFEVYLARSRFFIPEIAKTLKAHNMPQDLVYLAMIESGFANSAKSRARAVGPWQFMRQTGQRYGLTVNYWLDERRDTKKATLAAIKYLKELYQEFGSWELAFAGYNAGENKVRRAIHRYKTTDFWVIAKKRFFRRETRDYVPKIMAAAIITKNPEQFEFVDPFGGKRPYIADINSINLRETPKELGEETNGDANNGDVANNDTSEDEKTIEDPSEVSEEIAEEDTEDDPAQIHDEEGTVMSPASYMVSNPSEKIIEYTIKNPSDLFAISKASGLPYSTVKALNPELLRWCTPPYMKTYRLKLPRSIKERFLANYNDENFDRKVVFMKYQVKKGENIRKIAKRFSTEVDPIRELNQMNASTSYIPAGSTIALPLPTGHKRVIASHYDDKPMPPRRHRRRRRHYHKRRSSSARIQHHYRQQHYRLKPTLSRTISERD
ncbi:MAG: transglycosylase SLT domain-containing protein [Bacteriovoracia bacterium]